MPTPAENGRGAFAPVGVVTPEFVINPPAGSAPPPVARPASSFRWMPIDFVVKDDDDFTAGPGDYVPVPKTALRFWVEQDGPACFFVNAVFGWTGFQARNDHLAVLVDNKVHPLVVVEAMQAAPGLGIFRFGGPAMLPMNLAKGEHLSQVLLRGGHDDGDVHLGLWLPCKVLANPTNPLSFSVMHS